MAGSAMVALGGGEGGTGDACARGRVGGLPPSATRSLAFYKTQARTPRLKPGRLKCHTESAPRSVAGDTPVFRHLRRCVSRRTPPRATSPRAPRLFHHGRQRQPLRERGRVAQAPSAERHVATHRPGVLHRAHRVRRVLRLRQGDPEEGREALGAPPRPARLGDAPGSGDVRAEGVKVL